MQKFTRPLTREIEVGGERLALTFSESGLAVRPVGSRKAPVEMTWATLLCHLAGVSAESSHSPEHLTAAVQILKKGAPAKPAAEPSQSAATPAHGQAPAHAPVSEEPASQIPQ